MLIRALSATLQSPTFQKSTFCNNVILRYRGAIKLHSSEQNNMLNLMSMSYYVYHLLYLRYYVLKYQFVKSIFSQKFVGHVTSYFFISDSFFIANLMIRNFDIQTF